ncbi:MAG: hypothetical protein ACR2HD_06290 [Solirubrobacteraceae bacterium]
MATTAGPSVRRLAQYRPFERGGVDLRAVLQDLVLAAAVINGGRFDSIFACKQGFADLWSVEVEIEELRPALDALIERDLIVKTGKAFELTGQAATDLSARAREFDQIEERAFREWELAVRQMSPSVSAADMELLKQDLREWLHGIIIRHGAEAAMMLYPEEDRARGFFEQVDARGFEQLPERDEALCALREQALPLLIRHPTPDQRRFLAGLLNTSFYMCVLTIDPDAKQLVQEQMKGGRMYLDTNFMYAVLGAAPPEEVYSSRRLMQLCRDVSFELAITPWSVDELRTSIARARREIDDQKAFVRPELGEMMLRLSGEKGFNRLFWQAYNQKKTSPKDVFDRLEHFEAELDRYGIKVIADGCDRVDNQEERIRLYSSLLNSERWPKQREWIVLEHDAKCRLLVEQLRGDGKIRVSNARYWFLTYDGKLPRFAARVPDNGDAVPELPFCVSPSAWVQIIRALTPRTDDFDRTVVDLLTSPFVGYRRAVDPAILREVVGRMDHYEDASPEMAVAVLTDTAKVREIETAVATENEETVEDAVKAAYSAKAREMEEAIAASEQRGARAEEARAAADARTGEVEAARVQDQQAADEVQRQRQAEWESERQGLNRKLAEATSDRAGRKADERLRDLEEWREKRRRNVRILIGAALVIVGLAMALVLSLVILSNRWAIAGGAVCGVGIVVAGIRVLLPSRIASEFWLWAAVLVGLAAVAVAVAAASPH